MDVKAQSKYAALPTRAKWKLLRWSIMIAMIFWMLVYRLGMENAQLPEFEYVNF